MAERGRTSWSPSLSGSSPRPPPSARQLRGSSGTRDFARRGERRRSAPALVVALPQRQLVRHAQAGCDPFHCCGTGGSGNEHRRVAVSSAAATVRAPASAGASSRSRGRARGFETLARARQRAGPPRESKANPARKSVSIAASSRWGMVAGTAPAATRGTARSGATDRGLLGEACGYPVIRDLSGPHRLPRPKI